MDVEALRRSPIGQLVPITGHDPRIGEEYEYVAFVPDPLPASFDLKADTYAAVIDAAAAMARADQASSLLPNPGLLARPATRREAVSTSALEGTYAFLSDVFEADFLEDDELTSSVSEVRNYVTAAERAYEMVAEGQPISVRMLEDLQRELLRGTTSDGSHAGSVRTTQVFIGLGNRRVTSARFVPPPPTIGCLMVFFNGKTGFGDPPRFRRSSVWRCRTISSRRCTRSTTAMAAWVASSWRCSS